MKTINRVFTIAMLAGLVAFTTASCNKEKGTVKINMTDAASDDAEVKAVFVTVSKVYVDGKVLRSFEPKTIEISSYNNGSFYTLISDEINAKNYSEISLEIDFDKDESGDAPGTYVVKSDDKKEKLSSDGKSKMSVTANADFQVMENGATEVTIDMDLRKSMKRNSDRTYAFVSANDFEASFRAVDNSKSGSISGKVNYNGNDDEKVVVYVYEKGKYSSAEANLTGDIRFKNAVTSAEVDINGNYTLAFLEEGQYEVHVVRYQMNASNKAEFDTELQIQSFISGLLDSLKVTANATTTLDLQVI